MPFPESPRVIYKKNPLKEVICQLRFPPVLRINSEPPAAFQESIRGEYPLFREKPEGDEVIADFPPEIAKMLSISFRAGMTAYDFVSADEIWTVGLTREFLSLSTSQYERWEKFKEHLALPLESLCKEYSPAFFSRIGLRYKDVIDRTALGLSTADWSELLQPNIVGELSDPDIANSITSATRETVIRLTGNRGVVRIQHGLALNRKTNELGYLIDSDFFTSQKTEIDNAYEILDHFNRLAGRLFRWCITSKLHEAMEPESL